MKTETLHTIQTTFSNGKTYTVQASPEQVTDEQYFKEDAIMLNCAAFARDNSVHALKEELKRAVDSEFGKDNSRPFLAAAKILIALEEQRLTKD